jgi:ribosomal peptide maturation radical SAM protein 1
MDPKPVALISMPALAGRYPSFQLALLKPTLEKAGIPAQAFSLFMYFGTHVGWRVSEALSDVWPCMAGEWIWSKAAFGEFSSKEKDDEYFNFYSRSFDAICRNAGCSREDLIAIRDHAAPAFIDFCVDAIDWSRFGLVGFSVVFQQLLSSLALASALKRKHPDLPVIMGGASLEDDIAGEVIRRCPQIDFMHCGDGEISFPEMVRRLYAGQSMRGLRGLMFREDGEIQFAGRSPNFSAMDETPTPDFAEYFYARREGGYEQYDGSRDVLLPIEAARGCWWGEKNHCTFCGLNRSGMEFRAKSPERVIEQIENLSRRYGIFQFNAIDNIMAPEYAERLFGRLSAANSDFQLHYEIRPNFSRTQLGRMRRGGLYSVQPGVESFSTHILKIMRKLSTGMRNVELIKWCTYYRINNLYNILVQFPGETLEDYRLQSEIVPKLHHFQPPYAIVKARADRGSPMYSDPKAQCIVKMTPSRCYDYIFPEGEFDLDRVSYYFDHEMTDVVPDHEYNDLFVRVAVWQDRWAARGNRPFLHYRKAWSSIVIEDGRSHQVREWRFSDERADLYEFCADARSMQQLRRHFGAEPWVEPALAEFLSLELMLFLDGRYLSLALPENPDFDLSLNTATPSAEIVTTDIADPEDRLVRIA